MKLEFEIYDNKGIKGIHSLEKKVGKLIEAVSGDAIEKDSIKLAKVIAEDARNRAPLGPTGNLKRSLGAKFLARRGNNPRPALAGIDRKIAYHAWLIEYGYSKMAASPFFRPAVEAHSEGIIGNIKERIDKC